MYETPSNDIDEAAMHEAAKLDEYLVPIRLDIDHEGHRLRDTLTWNKNGEKRSSYRFFKSRLRWTS